MFLFAGHGHAHGGHGHSHGGGGGGGHAAAEAAATAAAAFALRTDVTELDVALEAQAVRNIEAGSMNMHGVFLHVLGDALGAIPFRRNLLEVGRVC
jgi:Co/Zn/Cd efflux system component